MVRGRGKSLNHLIYFAGKRDSNWLKANILYGKL